jgi:endonuclease/exonuclease/phosphatase family metal-dependent hydrolase
MANALRIETLNIWGGRLYHPLLEHLHRQAGTVDIFCFQEVYSTHSDRLSTREVEGPIPVSHANNDLPERANIYQELLDALPEFDGYFSSCQDRHAYSGSVNFDLSFGLATFARKTLPLDAVGEHFVHRQRNSIIGTNNATIGRNLQYIQFHLDATPVTVVNMHGLWNGKGKTDSLERLEQSRKIKAFLEAVSGVKILCGDLNLLPTTQSLALLEQDMRNLVKAYGITSTRSRFYEQQDRFADYVLVSSEAQVEEFLVLDEGVSDHLPLFLAFR